MRTLDRWVGRLLKLPNTIECPVMQILGRDHEPPLFTGPGQISIRSKTEMEFVMHATPRDCGEAFKRLVRAQKNPHLIHDQFRLIAVEYGGTEWHCGWVNLNLGETSTGVWRLSGSVNSISTEVSGRWASPESSVEVVYDTKLRIPTQMNMVTSVLLDKKEVFWSRGQGNKIVEVAGTKIEFFHATEGGSVWATARTSTAFCHPYAENWISEPLRLLLGQLVFPRLVARNKGNGSATVSLRPSPLHNAYTPFSSLLLEDPLANHDRFWEFYCDILTMVVSARDASGNPNFQAHPLTHYYHEISQATSGSLWVLCMTLASAAEGIAKLLIPPEERKADIDLDALANLKKHIKKWEGDENLRNRTLGSLAYFQEKGILQSLKCLCQAGVLELEQVKIWQSVRNQVMHGNLVSPWLDEELETKIHKLSELAHRLSAAYIRKCVSDSEVNLDATRTS